MGGTFLGLHSAMLEKGAKHIDIALAHVDKKNGLARLASFYDNIYVTDSQGNPALGSNVNVTLGLSNVNVIPV